MDSLQYSQWQPQSIQNIEHTDKDKCDPQRVMRPKRRQPLLAERNTIARGGICSDVGIFHSDFSRCKRISLELRIATLPPKEFLDVNFHIFKVCANKTAA